MIWRMRVSIPLPTACEAVALPYELIPRLDFSPQSNSIARFAYTKQQYSCPSGDFIHLIWGKVRYGHKNYYCPFQIVFINVSQVQIIPESSRFTDFIIGIYRGSHPSII